MMQKIIISIFRMNFRLNKWAKVLKTRGMQIFNLNLERKEGGTMHSEEMDLVLRHRPGERFMWPSPWQHKEKSWNSLISHKFAFPNKGMVF